MSSQRSHSKLPPRSFSFVDGWRILARQFARFVAVVTAKERFRGTARCRYTRTPNLIHFLLDALILDVPFSQLSKEQQFVVFIERPKENRILSIIINRSVAAKRSKRTFIKRPRHVENVRILCPCEQPLHVILFLLVKLESTREFIFVARQHFGSQSVQTHVLVESRNQRLLVTVRL